jgi:hypothetical protein
MAAKYLPGRFRTARHRQARIALGLFAATSLALACETIAQEEETVPAVLKTHDVAFTYRSAANFYACDELQNRVASILVALGARDDVDVKVNGCDLTTPLERNPADRPNMWNRANPADRFRRTRTDLGQSSHVRVRVMFPVVVTPKVLEEMDKDKSRRELLSRVTGNANAALADPIVFAAQRQQVKLNQRELRLRGEDCELLEQMSQSIFRDLDIKVVNRPTNCDPRALSHIPPQLTVEALLPAADMTRTPTLAPEENPEPEPAEPVQETPPQSRLISGG